MKKEPFKIHDVLFDIVKDITTKSLITVISISQCFEKIVYERVTKV